MTSSEQMTLIQTFKNQCTPSQNEQEKKVGTCMGNKLFMFGMLRVN